MYQYMVDILNKYTHDRSAIQVHFSNRTFTYIRAMDCDGIYIGNALPDTSELSVLLLLDEPIFDQSIISKFIHRYRGGVLLRFIETDRIGMFTDELPSPLAASLPNAIAVKIAMGVQRITYEQVNDDVRLVAVKAQAHPFTMILAEGNTKAHLDADTKRLSTNELIRTVNEDILTAIISNINNLRKFYSNNYNI